MIPFLAETDATVAPIGLGHLVTLVLTLAGTVGGSIFGGAKWLGRHFDKLGEERAKEREKDAAVNQAQNKVIEQQRSDYLSAIERRDELAAETSKLFTEALARQEEACALARADELRLVLRVAGIPYPGDTGKIKRPETETT